MVTDARGHEVPADSDPWGYREDMSDLSASIADVRSVADQAAAEAAVASLAASDLDPIGSAWWLVNPGGLYVYDGGGFVELAHQSDVDALTTAAGRIAYATATGTVQAPTTDPGAGSNTTVTLPSGRFTLAPSVTLNAQSSAPHQRAVSAISIGTGSFVARYVNTGGTAIGVPVNWIAVQQEKPAAAPLMMRTFAADDIGDGSGGDVFVTCPTPTCGNYDIPIQIASSWTDDEGTVYPIDKVVCGGCGTDITDTAVPVGGS